MQLRDTAEHATLWLHGNVNGDGDGDGEPQSKGDQYDLQRAEESVA